MLGVRVYCCARRCDTILMGFVLFLLCAGRVYLAVVWKTKTDTAWWYGTTGSSQVADVDFSQDILL